MPASKRSFRILGAVVALVLLDQITKGLARSALWHRGRLSYLGDFFRLEYAENPGAFLSLGEGLSEGMRFWILTVAVGLFLAVAIYYLVAEKNLDRYSVAALTLMVGGGVSNLLDRLFRTEGRVIDFLNIGVGNLRTGIFNVADMAIMAGLFLFILAGSQSKKLAKQG